MGLFSKLRDIFGDENPSRDWQLSPGQSLQFNFDNYTLNGVGPGSEIGECAIFGPAEIDSLARQDFLCYPDRGFSLWSDEGLVSGFWLCWDGDWSMHPYRLRKKRIPFAGACVHHERLITLGAQTPESLILAEFGPPRERDDDDDEIVLFYNQDGYHSEFELTAGGLLKAVNVYFKEEAS